MHIVVSTNCQAVLWVTASTALFSIVFASGKFAGDSVSALQILLLRYISGFGTLLFLNLTAGNKLKTYQSQAPLTHLARAICGSLGGVSAIYAAQNMPIVDATAIGLLDGALVVLLGIFILRESVSVKHWLAILICFIGAAGILIEKNAFQTLNMNYIWPASIAFLGALLIALECILIKQLSVKENPMTVLLYVNFFGMVLLLIPALIFWQSKELTDNLPFLALGPLAIFAQYLTIRGYRLADVAIVGPVNYSWIVFAALIGFFWFGEKLTTGTILGSLMIISGGVLLARIRP